METTDKSVFIDKDRFKQIFRDHWDEFKANYPRYNTENYEEILRKMLNSGDPEKMGYSQYRCLN